MIRRWFTLSRYVAERTVEWAGHRMRSVDATMREATAEVTTHQGYAVRACAATAAEALARARTLPAFGRPSIDDLAQMDAAVARPILETEDYEALFAEFSPWGPWVGQLVRRDETVEYADCAGAERAYARRSYHLDVRPLDPRADRSVLRVRSSTWNGLLDEARDEIAWRAEAARPAQIIEDAYGSVIFRADAARLMLELVATALVSAGTNGTGSAAAWLVDDPDGRLFDDSGSPTAVGRFDQPWLTGDGRVRPGHIALTEGRVEVGFTKLCAAPDAPVEPWPAGLVVDELRLVNDPARDGLLFLQPRQSWWYSGPDQRAIPVTVAGAWTAYQAELEIKPIGPQAVQVAGLRAAGGGERR